MSTVEPQVMTVEEVAEYLRLNEMTVYKLAQEGKIPALKIGRIWRFRKDLIDEWFRAKACQVFEEPESTEPAAE